MAEYEAFANLEFLFLAHTVPPIARPGTKVAPPAGGSSLAMAQIWTDR